MKIRKNMLLLDTEWKINVKEGVIYAAKSNS